MSRAKSAFQSKLVKAMADSIKFLVEDIDRRERIKEPEEATEDIMKEHCTHIASDGSRTFSF